jgi:hypothetical protein
MHTPICIRGAKDICAAIGENPKEMLRLVEEHDLPAWRRDGKGAWRALPDDLRNWLAMQRDRNLGRHGRLTLRGVCGPEEDGEE